MRNIQRGFVVPLLVAVIALLLAGGAYYIIHRSTVAQIPENTVSNSTPQPTQTIPGTAITLTTIDICSPVVKDTSILLFTDKNNKIWTVDYSKATFTSFGEISKKVLSTNLQDWIKTLYRVGQPQAEICGAPGMITVTGTLDGTTVFASHIELSGQG